MDCLERVHSAASQIVRLLVLMNSCRGATLPGHIICRFHSNTETMGLEWRSAGMRVLFELKMQEPFQNEKYYIALIPHPSLDFHCEG